MKLRPFPILTVVVKRADRVLLRIFYAANKEKKPGYATKKKKDKKVLFFNAFFDGRGKWQKYGIIGRIAEKRSCGGEIVAEIRKTNRVII